VRTSGDAVSGSLNDGGKSWHSARNLNVSQSYTVTATGTAPSGEKITTTSTFRTLTPADVPRPDLRGYHQTYGVGMPILLTFSRPSRRRRGRAVARAHHVKPVIGAWYWDGDEHCTSAAGLLAGLHHGQLHAHLNGVEGAKGVYGAANLTQTFDIAGR